MRKILSVLEKYNLIEKEDEKTSVSKSSDQNFLDTDFISQPDQEQVVYASPIDNETAIKESIPLNQVNNLLNTSGSSINYDKTMSLEEIYAMYGLNTHTTTETVFVLENLINALPADLPEYVKKTTLNNILIASSMNLEKLLADGNKRSTQLNTFADDYSNQTENDITSLKQEIDKLSAIINDYHQKIKQQELLTKEQLSLIKLEDERLQNILGFFSN